MPPKVTRLTGVNARSRREHSAKTRLWPSRRGCPNAAGVAAIARTGHQQSRRHNPKTVHSIGEGVPYALGTSLQNGCVLVGARGAWPHSTSPLPGSAAIASVVGHVEDRSRDTYTARQPTDYPWKWTAFTVESASTKGRREWRPFHQLKRTPRLRAWLSVPPPTPPS